VQLNARNTYMLLTYICKEHITTASF